MWLLSIDGVWKRNIWLDKLELIQSLSSGEAEMAIIQCYF